ncbi:peptidase U62 [bacterium]|nr:peptidase U62 [bacterium]
MKQSVLIGLVIIGIMFFMSSSDTRAADDILLKAMELELNRSFSALGNAEQEPLYYLQYAIVEDNDYAVSASLGAIEHERLEHKRYLRVDARVGSMQLDNTHELRDDGYDYSDFMPQEVEIPIDDDLEAIRAVIWSETDKQYKNAQERLIKVKANKMVKVEEEDTSADFSEAKPVVCIDQSLLLEVDSPFWTERLKKISTFFKQYPWIYDSGVSLRAQIATTYLLSSEGTRIKEVVPHFRLSAFAQTMADDGMELYLHLPFDCHTLEGLPSDEVLMAGLEDIVKDLETLRTAPLVEPYTGPAILMNRASGVFFHEIFGHRIEGHRQKSTKEGQTFTRKVGESILPDFISVYDDPTLKEWKNIDLNGYYRFDDEGMPAEKVLVVDKGILKNFLMSRSPIQGFNRSNGHGRREHGLKVVSRQGNLIVHSEKTVPFERLRAMLIEECTRQNKPYGLIFDDLSGGFTVTERSYAQVFKVIPLLAKKVYTDGRPDEIVRGVDIVGTPLLSFSKILVTADDVDVFNGYCGAESGMVPVSAVSPSILVAEIEIEKKYKDQDKPPLLSPPAHNP